MSTIEGEAFRESGLYENLTKKALGIDRGSTIHAISKLHVRTLLLSNIY